MACSPESLTLIAKGINERVNTAIVVKAIPDILLSRVLDKY